MEHSMIRLLRADEIECRIGTISEKGVSLLLYKDARADMKILDEVYGPLNWQRRHEVIGGNLYCTVSVWDQEKEQWISKMDVGTESYTEKEKGQASDSFKRACVSLGIGRELYTAPFIWVSAGMVKIEKRFDSGGSGREKLFTYDKFKVVDISYNDSREIVKLTVINQNGKAVYHFDRTGEARQASDNGTAGQRPQNQEQRLAQDRIQEMNKELMRTGVALDTVLQRYGIQGIEEMDSETYRKAMNSLKRTRSKAA